jgi:hypothetical protein
MEDAMGKINYARVFLGGLLAGVIFIVGGFFTNGIVLGRDWEAAMKALGHTMPSSALGIFVIWGFLAGFSVLWLYAAARPRYGAGAKTAAKIGIAYWFIAQALPSLGQWGFGLFPKRLIVISTLAGLVEAIVASVFGAALYKEKTAE